MTRKERKEAKKREEKRLKAKRARNKEFARVTYVFVATVSGAAGIYRIFSGEKRARRSYSSPYNARQNSNAKRVTRGTIVDRNGNVLAKTDTAADGSETREYPYGKTHLHMWSVTACRANPGSNRLEKL